MRTLWLTIVILVIGAVSIQAAPNYLGPSGNIMTPDELTVPQGEFSIGYHRFLDLGFSGATTDLDVWSGNYGLTPNIEVGLSVVDPRNNGSDVGINGKWRLLDETAARPAIAVGVTDVAGNAIDDDSSFYVLATKALTRYVPDEISPLRGTLGIGSGFYDGVFVGLDWTANPQLSVMAEYVRGGDLLDANTLINAGVRYAISPGFRLDASVIDFDELAFGASFTRGF